MVQTNEDAAQGEIEAVVFDVGRVIVQWDLRYLFEKLIDDPEELDFVLSNVITEAWHFEHDAGRPLAEMVAERKAIFPAHGGLIDAYTARFLETIPGRIPGTADLIESLAEGGIPLYAITNFGAEFWAQFFPTEPLLTRFRDIVVSGSEKIVKPNPAIFQLAEDRFGHRSGAMLFIDDNQANIDAARDLGWQVHHFSNAEQLAIDLRNRGLVKA
ncbi:MAG: HAD-IA family hydrolase [Erythrobacter sp.]